MMKMILTLCSVCQLFVFSNSFAIRPGAAAILSPVIDYGPVVETAAFPGGAEALVALLDSTVVFPVEEDGMEGQLVLSFAVGSDGQVFDVSIEEGVGLESQEPVIQALKAMPRWRPARFGETPICMRMRLVLAINPPRR
jgi:hypothetical protein